MKRSKTEARSSNFKNNFLPFDFIAFDILPCLAVKALLRFRCLSTRYRNAIDDPEFVRRQVTKYCPIDVEPDLLLFASLDDHASSSIDHNHGHRFPKQIDLYPLLGNDGMSILQTRVEPLSTLVGRRPTSIKSCCNGLICFVSRLPRQNPVVFLFNPFKQESLVLPPPPYNLSSVYYYLEPKPRELYGLGYDSLTNKYMVVHVFSSTDTNMTGEVLKLGGDEEYSWRRLSNFPSGRLLLTVDDDRPLYNQGALHWVAYRVEFGDKAVISFNIGSEDFTLTHLPDFLPSYKLTVLKGKLALYFELIEIYDVPTIEIWVLRREKRWVREYKIYTNTRSVPIWVKEDVTVLGFGKHGIIIKLGKNYDHLYYYKPETKEFKKVPIAILNNNKKATILDILSYKGSLVSLKRWRSSSVKNLINVPQFKSS